MKHKDLKIVFCPVLTPSQVTEIEVMSQVCQAHQDIAFKLELGYKLKDAAVKGSPQADVRNNEFLAYLENQLIAYVGICQFVGFQMEVSGMVDPKYRHQGIFTKLMDLVFEEAKIRNAQLLLLCDTRSAEGKQWISQQSFRWHHTEYEMKLSTNEVKNRVPITIELVEATNSDIPVIKELNSEFHFADNEPLVPEEEAKRGIQIYLGKKDGQVISKIHVSREDDKAWIYGFVVSPSQRGQGLGKQILIRTIDLYSSLGVNTIFLQVDSDNPTAEALYRRVGFVPIYSMEYHEWISLPNMEGEIIND